MFKRGINFRERNIYLLWSIVFLILSLFGFWWRKENISQEVSSADIMIMLDVSKSMEVIDADVGNAGDIADSRLLKTKQYIDKLIFALPNNRYGIWIFAWESVGIVPLTSDTHLVSTMLWWVDRRNITKQWTDIQEALLFAFDRYDTPWWVLILFSDGWEDQIILDEQVKDIVTEQEIQVIVVGVGDESWGPIPWWSTVLGEAKRKIYNGEIVISTPNREWLQDVAQQLWWSFFELDSPDLMEYVTNLPWTQITQDIKIESSIYRWYVAWSLLLFLAYLLFPLRGSWKENNS